MSLAPLIALVGSENVRTDADTCGRAVSSWYPVSTKEKQAQGGNALRPMQAVVYPGETEEVAAIVRWANATKTRLIPVGGASNTVGANDTGDSPAVALDLSRLRSVSWDEESLTVHVGAGCVLSSLEDELNRHDYTLGQFPQTFRLATVGGCIATDAIGAFSGKYGRQSDQTIGLEVVLPDGEVVNTSAQGTTSALHRLIPGSEGAFGIVTSATLKMWPVPEARAYAVFTFPNVSDALDALRLVYRSDARPTSVRLFDESAASEWLTRAGLPSGLALLILAFEGSELVQTGMYQLAHAICQKVGGTPQSPELGDNWFEERFQTTWMSPNGRPGGLADAFSVYASWSTIKEVQKAMHRAVQNLVTSLDIQVIHADENGAGFDVLFEAQAEPGEPQAALALYERIVAAGWEACRDAGGKMAFKGGIGVARRAFAEIERGPVTTNQLRALKAALDPNSILPDN